MSTADPHPAPNDPTLPPLNDPVEEEDEKNTHGTPGDDEEADTASGGSPD
ncbi:hypothetical protein [Microbacterium sp. 18062]|nr:hypothetical protein [Microbacterium sp. 18062]